MTHGDRPGCNHCRCRVVTFHLLHQDSYKYMQAGMLSDARFLQSIFAFSQNEKDFMNDETVELMAPYLELDGFNPAVARNASKAAEGLCTWCRAMTYYHEASKVSSMHYGPYSWLLTGRVGSDRVGSSCSDTTREKPCYLQQPLISIPAFTPNNRLPSHRQSELNKQLLPRHNGA